MQEESVLIYELRKYTVIEGKMQELLDRFDRYTFNIFEKHGMKIEGFWCDDRAENSHNELYYILSFKDHGHLETSCKAMSADPEWIKVKKETEKDGPLVVKVERTILREPSFVSKLKNEKII